LGDDTKNQSYGGESYISANVDLRDPLISAKLSLAN